MIAQEFSLRRNWDLEWSPDVGTPSEGTDHEGSGSRVSLASLDRNENGVGTADPVGAQFGRAGSDAQRPMIAQELSLRRNWDLEWSPDVGTPSEGTDHEGSGSRVSLASLDRNENVVGTADPAASLLQGPLAVGVRQRRVSGLSDDGFSRVKFLCSFGGSIQIRPSDGKLRYVGGETRIVTVNRDINYSELMFKFTEFYGQALTLKYQLPNWDLDTLVSVSCDEDLEILMEEYDLLETSAAVDGSQRLRVFLFSAEERELPGQGHNQTQRNAYIDAVNGLQPATSPIPRSPPTTPRSQADHELGSHALGGHQAAPYQDYEQQAEPNRGGSLHPRPVTSPPQSYSDLPRAVNRRESFKEIHGHPPVRRESFGRLDASSPPSDYSYLPAQLPGTSSPHLASHDPLPMPNPPPLPLPPSRVGFPQADHQREQPPQVHNREGPRLAHVNSLPPIHISGVQPGLPHQGSDQRGLASELQHEGAHPHLPHSLSGHHLPGVMTQNVTEYQVPYQVHPPVPSFEASSPASGGFHEGYMRQVSKSSHIPHQHSQQNLQQLHSQHPPHHVNVHQQRQHPHQQGLQGTPLQGSHFQDAGLQLRSPRQHSQAAFDDAHANVHSQPFQGGHSMHEHAADAAMRAEQLVRSGLAESALMHRPSNEDLQQIAGHRDDRSGVAESALRRRPSHEDLQRLAGQHGHYENLVGGRFDHPGPQELGQGDRFSRTTQHPFESHHELVARSGQPLVHDRCPLEAFGRDRQQGPNVLSHYQPASHPGHMPRPSTQHGGHYDDASQADMPAVYQGGRGFNVDRLSSWNVQQPDQLMTGELGRPQGWHETRWHEASPSASAGNFNHMGMVSRTDTRALHPDESSMGYLNGGTDGRPQLHTGLGPHNDSGLHGVNVYPSQGLQYDVQGPQLAQRLPGLSIPQSTAATASQPASPRPLPQQQHHAPPLSPIAGPRRLSGNLSHHIPPVSTTFSHTLVEPHFPQSPSKHPRQESLSPLGSDLSASGTDLSVSSPLRQDLQNGMAPAGVPVYLPSPMKEQLSKVNSPPQLSRLGVVNASTRLANEDRMVGLTLEEGPNGQAAGASNEGFEASLAPGTPANHLPQQPSADASLQGPTPLNEVPKRTTQTEGTSQATAQPEAPVDDSGHLAEDMAASVLQGGSPKEKRPKAPVNSAVLTEEATPSVQKQATPSSQKPPLPAGRDVATSPMLPPSPVSVRPGLQKGKQESSKPGEESPPKPVEDDKEVTAAEAEEAAKWAGLQTIENDDLEELKELGSGTFGTVYHGKWRGTDVAIKRLKSSVFEGRGSEADRTLAEFWKEAKTLSELHHPNVVAFYGVVKDKEKDKPVATVTEFMVNGSLKQVLARKDRTIDRRKRILIAMDAAFGMEYLHFKHIVHFDLKCDNLLVNMRDPHRPICKVGDLGLSKVKKKTMVSGGVRGTLPWMAPELLDGNSALVTEKVDVYSFGIVLWELLTGEEPYAAMHYGAIIGGIVNNTLRPPIPSWCDPAWRSLMEHCWQQDHTKRPSFKDVANELRAMYEDMTPKAGGR